MLTKKVPAHRIQDAVAVLERIPAEACVFQGGPRDGEKDHDLYMYILRNHESLSGTLKLLVRQSDKIRESHYKKNSAGEIQYQIDKDGRPDRSAPLFVPGGREKMEEELEEHGARLVEVEIYPIPRELILRSALAPGLVSYFSFCVDWTGITKSEAKQGKEEGAQE